MPIEQETLKTMILDAIPDAEIKLSDMVGDSDHYYLEITSSIFNDKSLIQQHKIVNKALTSCLGTSLHALKIKTFSK
jgi:stress-induced morphogen